MARSLYFFLLFFLLSITAACLPALAVETPTPNSPTEEAEAAAGTALNAEDEMPAPTATIVWFPPTPTPSPFPTQVITPTPEMRPGLGQVILTDDFSDPSAWMLNSAGDTRAALSRGELTLAIAPTTSRDYIISLREEPLLSDFYMEITASLSMCRGEDEYGILIRAGSPQDYYRLALRCSSQARLDRIIQGQTTSPQPWVLSGAVPPGAPGFSRIAVWAVGKEMRFFVNNEYLFTVSDPMLSQGSLGVFARSVGENAVTINFSDLIVREAAIP